MSGDGERACGEGASKHFLNPLLVEKDTLLYWEVWIVALDWRLINWMTLGHISGLSAP